jgi:tetratricopeptide (TPR) repeat protein
MSQLDLIDNYFTGKLSGEEAALFEKKIAEDPAFAEEVAFYCDAISMLKNEVTAEKKKRFREIYHENKPSRPAPVMRMTRIIKYAAAAAVIATIAIGAYFYMQPPSVQKLTDDYIKTHFQMMPIPMGNVEDSLLHNAKQLFNNNKLEEALLQFEKIVAAYPDASEPKRLAGIVSMRLKDYDKAIGYFSQLENLQLYSNPGKLYHALALIKRDRPGDRKNAKQILEFVIAKNLEGKETARNWLRSL